MSALLEFLNEMFGPSSGATAEDVKSHFNADLGVMVDIVGELFLFKYDMITVKWNPVTHECRGTIMERLEDGSWKYVSRPPSKFFNLREGHCEYSDKNAFIRDFENLELVQKADGSAIQMYWWNGEWRISTLGKIIPATINGYSFTYADMFKKLFGVENFEKADKEYCYFHELCTAYNIIVTHYPKDTIFLLLARKVENGEYMSVAELDAHAVSFGEGRPVRLKVSELPLREKSLEALEEYVELAAEDPKYGMNSEGFVLSNPRPVGKLKNQRYLVLHRLIGGGDKGHTVNNLIDMFFTGIIDDFYADLTEIQQKAIDSLKSKISGINVKIEEFISSINLDEIDRKEYALKVNANSELKRFSNYLFQRYMDHGYPRFSEWLLEGKGAQRNWGRYEDMWKSEFTI